MKIVKLPILGLSLVLLVASCTKDDMHEAATDAVTTDALASDATDTVGWKSATQWETADQETFSVRYLTLNDAAITSDVADNGLVLVFKKSGVAINALPFEEGAAANEETASENTTANYWYHQVTEGSLLISCDLYNKTATPDVANSFKYFILTPERLQQLATAGYTTEKLLSLNYAAAAVLLKETK